MDRMTFEVLCSVAEKTKLSLLADTFGWAEEELNEVKTKLQTEHLLEGTEITEKGIQTLEPYKVRKAVFLAAGFGSRMVPITINTPKPMVKVHGKRIIETLLDAVVDAGIREIYIVTGYLGEQFELLQKKYPMIKIIDNPEYDGTGTISSFYYARKQLRGSYVLESDLVVKNPKIIRKYQYNSNFLGTKMQETNDWWLKADPEGRISEIGVGGEGDNLYKLIGISFWDAEDGKKLEADLEEVYHQPEGKKLPMSYVPFRVHKNKYQVSIRPCDESDVVEIDSFSELQAYDEAYKI